MRGTARIHFPASVESGEDGAVTGDPGEELFERYIEQRGYSVLDYHPDLGTAKRPDYLVRADGTDVVVEVESFKTAVVRAPTEPGGSAALSDLRPVRNKISTGAEQLEGISGYPLIVVIVNPYHIAVPLVPSHLVAAMYGDLAFEFLSGGAQQWSLGRNGRLHVGEPDGTSHGNHPYLSAVGVLRAGSGLDLKIVADLRSKTGTGNPLQIVAQALSGDGSTQVQREALSLDVFETVSDAALAVPRTIFNGWGDTRWGRVSPGHYGPIASPDAASSPIDPTRSG
jgi:hypothetical protein